jgi:hypothetical protein
MAMEDMATAQAPDTVIIVILITTATITTVIESLMDIKNLIMTRMTIAMDQGMVPAIGSEIKGQGGQASKNWSFPLAYNIFDPKNLLSETNPSSLLM